VSVTVCKLEPAPIYS